jgi:hypothetical protein
MLRRTKASVSGMKQPELSPLKNCNPSSTGRFSANGVRAEVAAKDKAAPIKIRRGP